MHLDIILVNNQLDALEFLPDRHTRESPTQSEIYTRWCIYILRFSWWWALGCL